MGERGAEWQSQFSSEMSFAPGEERTLAEKQRSSALGDFMLPDTLMCHRIYSQCITRRGTQVVNDMFIPSSQCSQLITCHSGMMILFFLYDGHEEKLIGWN